jgi:glucoamylase
MSARLLVGAVALSTAVTGAVVAMPGASGAPAADRAAPQQKSTWAEADKTGFGTSRSHGSNVWFTLQGGRTSEVFYPDLSTPSVRSLELLVQGDGFLDRASSDMRTTVTRPDPRSLRFTSVHEDEDGRYRLTEEHLVDPYRDAYVVRIRLESLDGGKYEVHVDYDPALDNSGMDDHARTVGKALVATDDRVSTALMAEPALAGLGSGLKGAPYTKGKVGPGNVAQRARISGLTGRPGKQTATLTLGLAGDVPNAVTAANASRRMTWKQLSRAYDAGWHRYVSGLKDVPASAAGVRDTYLASLLVVAAAEDKQNPGAFVASPSAPWVWGNEVEDLSSPSGAYHLVWSRDAYEFGTALLAAGDRAAARRIVDWLFETQQKADGSFPQNSDVTGKPVWSELQLDEVALPIVLATLTGRTGPKTWRGVRKAANFLVGFQDEETGLRAPFSPQERWENQSGFSPNSIAAQIAGLVSAADIARANGAKALAKKWLRVADRWQAKVKRWTVSTNGPLSDAPYFLRLSKDGKPNQKTTYGIGDGGPGVIDQRRVVDPSFLTLVRFGILPTDDPAVENSLAVVDDKLKVETPNGPFWHRFSFDGYGETRTGGEWEVTDPNTGTTLGRGWPILTGERGEYAVSAGEDGSPYLAAMAAAANETGLISEQVWDGRAPTGEACCPAGEGTRAATPLTWSHAGLVRLAWTIQRGVPVDQQVILANRY